MTNNVQSLILLVLEIKTRRFLSSQNFKYRSYEV